MLDVITQQSESISKRKNFILDNIRKLNKFSSIKLSILYILDYWSILQLSQIRYSLVVILGLNSVSEVQYKGMMTDRWWKVSTGIIDVVKSEV